IRLFTMSSPVYRGLGVLYGQFIGDALGSRYEFESGTIVKNKLQADRDSSGLVPLLGEGPFGYGPGMVTDDGEMAMSLLSSCLSHEVFDPSSVACAYVRWAQSNPPDIGNTCRGALTIREKIPKDWPNQFTQEQKDKVRMAVEENVRNRNKHSLSNGSLMRQSVLTAVYAANDFGASTKENAEKFLLSAVEFDTLLTHSNPVAIEATKTYALILFHLVRGKTPEEAIESALSTVNSKEIRSLVDAAREKAVPVTLPDGSASNGDDSNIGYFGVSLQIAVHYLLHASSFSSGVESAVAIGGDTDTNGCIAGALLGARFGQEGIPAEWIQSVEKAPLRLKGENGIESFEQMVEGIRKRYDGTEGENVE
ncbi:hypothetical protein PENTCL1PPCAC_13679, partial [Pristionchus entomophagus]